MVERKCNNKICPISVENFSFELRPEDFENPSIWLRSTLPYVDAKTIDTLKKRFDRGGNPIYVWRAIEYCLKPFNVRHQSFLVLVEEICKDNPEQELSEEQATVSKLYHKAYEELTSDESIILLPAWCQDYLYEVSINLRKLPSNKLGLFDPKAAIEKLSRDFGFVRKGWNAFYAYMSDFHSRMAWGRFKALTDDGESAAFARQALLEKYGLADERSLFRILARGRAQQGDQT